MISFIKTVVMLGLVGLGLNSNAAQNAVREEIGEILKEISNRNPELTAQQERIQAARFRKWPALLSLVPSLNLEAKQGVPGTESDSSDGGHLQATSEVNLFRFGADLNALHAAEADELYEQSQYQSLFLKSEEQGFTSFVRVVQLKKKIEVLSRNIEYRQKLLSVARQRYQKGYLAQQEVDKLIIDLENAKTQLAQIELAAIEAQGELRTQVGRELKSGPLSEFPWGPLKFDSVIEHVESWGLAELEFRPDVQSSRHEVEAASQRYSQKNKAWLPTLDLNGNLGYYAGYEASSNVDGVQWAGAVSISFPLFDRLVRKSAATDQWASVKSAEASLELARRTAQKALDSAREGYLLTLRSAHSRDQTLKLSKRLYVESIRRLELGRANANEVGVDQSRLSDSEIYGVDSWAEVHFAYLKLCHAVGKSVIECGASNGF